MGQAVADQVHARIDRKAFLEDHARQSLCASKQEIDEQNRVSRGGVAAEGGRSDARARVASGESSGANVILQQRERPLRQRMDKPTQETVMQPLEAG